MEKAIKRWSPLFVLPTLLAFTIGFIIPFFEGLYLSFCQFTTVKNAKFTGFGNYKKIFSDLTFLSSFKFTVLFAVASIVLILSLIHISEPQKLRSLKPAGAESAGVGDRGPLSD